MTDNDNGEEDAKFEIFRDGLSTEIVKRPAPPKKQKRQRNAKGRKNAIKPVYQAEEGKGTEAAADLADFCDTRSQYLAAEIFISLPLELRTLTYQSSQTNASLSDHYSSSTTLESIIATVPPSVTDSLSAYALISPPKEDTTTFLLPILQTYISTILTPPPSPSIRTRPSACELCDRSHIPLTVHHLIPRSYAAKAVKKGWCEKGDPERLLAYICRACHNFIHDLADNEELAREPWAKSVEGWWEAWPEEVGKWVGWVGKVRWKKK
ncbi:MAG: hypothetical protein M1820_009125 [Bogoriella megaspora]|nr:MAG: hypothetical protein M1820_009125 [Bogoriella megaspora]